MARLQDIRHQLQICPQEEQHARLSGVVAAEVVEADEGWSVEDDDFWEALDLLETSCKIITRLLGDAVGVEKMDGAAIENHCCDIQQFVDQFLADEPKASRRLDMESSA